MDKLVQYLAELAFSSAHFTLHTALLYSSMMMKFTSTKYYDTTPICYSAPYTISGIYTGDIIDISNIFTYIFSDVLENANFSEFFSNTILLSVLLG